MPKVLFSTDEVNIYLNKQSDARLTRLSHTEHSLPMHWIIDFVIAPVRQPCLSNIGYQIYIELNTEYQ